MSRLSDPPETLAPEDESTLAGVNDADLEEESGVELELDAHTPESVKRGVAVIRAHWKNAPNGPGVYRMPTDAGEVLYVGKA
ncbi:MAG: excinuclease ABC subunit C, partial [Methylocystis sp.]|nr:excinuclease ABC subunit C [Methylocystis sp.]